MYNWNDSNTTIKKVLFILLAILSIGNALAIDQIGIAYRYNGKKQRTPLGGVYIKVATSPNGVVSQELNGQFVLKLKDINMGDAMGTAIVQKVGMMVFNKDEVNRWSVQRKPLVLIICDADEFQKQKERLIAIGRNQAEKKYKQKIELLKAQNAKQQLSLDQYYTKLDSIEKEKDNALAHMEEYADLFARIDESEIDTLAQRAIELFNQGKLEESIKLFEQGSYLRKIDDALKVKAQAMELRQKADSAEMLANKDIEEYLKSIEAQVAAYKLNNEWDKAGALLKGLANKLNSLDAIRNYAYFTLNQNHYNESEIYLRLYINKISFSGKSYEPDLALNYNLLAILYARTQRYNESEQMNKMALDIYKRLANANPAAFELYLAGCYITLADLYRDTQRFDESEQIYKESLKICKRLDEIDPLIYEHGLADCYNSLAGLYLITQRFNEAEQMYKSALEIRKRLAESNPQAYEQYLAANYNDLANLYLNAKRFDESEKMYKLAIDMYKRLAEDNPVAYEPALAQIYHNLANLYNYTLHFTESEQMYKVAIDIYKRLTETNPQACEPDLAQSYHDLATLYFGVQRFDKVELMHKAALVIHKRLAKDNPQIYKSYLAVDYINIAYTFILSKQFVQAEQYSIKALKVDSTKYFANTNLALAYLLQGKYTDAEKIYIQYKSELKNDFLNDFEEFAKAGIIPTERKADVEKIKKMLKEE